MPEQEKTEQATPKKREDERKKGNIFMSKDITTIFSLIIGFYAISMFIGGFVAGAQDFYRTNMLRVVTAELLQIEDVMEIGREAAILFARSALPPMLIICLAMIVAVLVQTKLLFSRESLKFKFERLDIIKGIKKLFSMRSLVELIKSILKITVLIFLLYQNIKRIIGVVPGAVDWTIEQAISFAGRETMAVVQTVGIAFAAIATLDYFYQRWEYEKNIRMTKQEVKDEYKQIEGNPEIRGKRREKQREYAMQRMMAAVKEADVVVRNPTHFAVAIKYKLDVDLAPTVLAKGVDHVALRIVEEAEKHNVLTVENRPLARSLYELSEIDELIPPELYQPVAELLAWLYSTKNKVR